MVTWSVFAPNYGAVFVNAPNEKAARALARYMLGLKKLPKGTTLWAQEE